ncbi:Mobile element protein [Dickeya dianthicola RNS04.9]|nr:Mobile element protein [Dickeya dianthicola RNS04.9]
MYPRRAHCQSGRDEINYIECDYNHWRQHSARGGLNPEQFENQNLA